MSLTTPNRQLWSLGYWIPGGKIVRDKVVAYSYRARSTGNNGDSDGGRVVESITIKALQLMLGREFSTPWAIWLVSHQAGVKQQQEGALAASVLKGRAEQF